MVYRYSRCCCWPSWLTGYEGCEGTGCNGMRWNGMGWEEWERWKEGGMGWDRIGWDGLEWEGMGWELRWEMGTGMKWRETR